ncbi:hypothetical protein B9Z51_10780 [Limnohabitans sp. T6-5]|uniref:hypothetical protein n=1 Tax=Limnohabitans sp. T6-5 TaxID=1100724 RepID=UPI000D346CC0|nr:hypothetical protein [Limnohabitans sp. T6-5]PUE09358.1 hypothetical protein B9Z51_10780 [Limnohabitans sp. T6-5]
MAKPLNSIFDDLLKAAQEAALKQDKWIIIDRAYAHLDDLSSHDYQQVLQRILALIEKYPELDYGGPGPFGSFLETQAVGAYSPQLVASLQRQPSVQVLGWLDRTMRMDESQRTADGGIEPSYYAEVVTTVLQHPMASENCKSFARMCVEE